MSEQFIIGHYTCSCCHKTWDEYLVYIDRYYRIIRLPTREILGFGTSETSSHKLLDGTIVRLTKDIEEIVVDTVCQLCKTLIAL